MAGRIAVVDEANRFLRWESRKAIHTARLPHRSVQVLIFDSQDRLTLQRRHHQKDTCPGFWDVSCSGHVEESDYFPEGPDARLDEVYAEVAKRELQEELGVAPVLERLGRYAPLAGVHYEQFQLFRGRSDGPFTIQEEEVEELCFVHPEELVTLERAGAQLTPSLIYLSGEARRLGIWGSQRTS